MSLQATILGCGSSGGVPRPALGWGACDPADPRNRRRRCALLVEREGRHGRTSVLIDTGPDLREQLISAGVERLDAVLYTHDHADHTHGIDDLRAIVMAMRRRIPVFATDITAAGLRSRFGYAFETPQGSGYPPILELNRIEPGRAVTVDGPGGPIEAEPLSLEHGPDYEAIGFRFGGLVYAPDVSRIPDAAAACMRDAEILILDCLRDAPHGSHFNYAQSMAAIAKLTPKRAVLTNLHSDLDYASLSSRLPINVEAAWDGMRLSLDG